MLIYKIFYLLFIYLITIKGEIFKILTTFMKRTYQPKKLKELENMALGQK